MMSAAGVGALVGALAVATINPRHNRGLALIGVMVTFGTMLILFSLSTYGASIALSFGLIAMVGMFQTPYNTLSNSIVLDSAPAEMRGRVMALLSLDRVVIVVGGTLAGFLAGAVGPQVAQVAFGGMCIVGALAMTIFAPALRRVQ